MSNTHSTLESLFSDIADAIRGKDGTSADIKADNFPSRITAIPSGSIFELINETSVVLAERTYENDGNAQETISHSVLLDTSDTHVVLLWVCYCDTPSDDFAASFQFAYRYTSNYSIKTIGTGGIQLPRSKNITLQEIVSDNLEYRLGSNYGIWLLNNSYAGTFYRKCYSSTICPSFPAGTYHIQLYGLKGSEL